MYFLKIINIFLLMHASYLLECIYTLNKKTHAHYQQFSDSAQNMLKDLCSQEKRDTLSNFSFKNVFHPIFTIGNMSTPFCFNSGFQYHWESCDSGAKCIFCKINRMMEHWAQKIPSKFKVHFSFCLAEKIIEILALKTFLNGLRISNHQKVWHLCWPKK